MCEAGACGRAALPHLANEQALGVGEAVAAWPGRLRCRAAAGLRYPPKAAAWFARSRRSRDTWADRPGGPARRFSDLRPAVDIRYVSDSSTALIPEDSAARLDVGLVALPPRLPEPLLAISLMTEPIALVCGLDHLLAGRKRVTVKSLADQDYVWSRRCPGSCTASPKQRHPAIALSPPPARPEICPVPTCSRFGARPLRQAWRPAPGHRWLRPLAGHPAGMGRTRRP